MKIESKFKETKIEMIPENWEVKTLEQVAVFKNGKSSPLRSDNYSFLVFGSNGVIGHANEYNSTDGTVIIGRVGSYCGSIYYSQNKCWVTDNAIIGNAKEGNSPEFLYYLLLNLHLNQYRSGSGQPLLNQGTLNSLKTIVPNSTEQHAITKILSALEEKIELNHRMNKTLEAIGQVIFKRWFVDFEFPDEQGKPYKSSGGEMVDSELGEIPKGWEVKELKHLINRNREKIKSKEEWKNKNIIDLSTMPQFSICLDSFQKGENFDSNIFKLKELDILFGSIRPYFGKAGFSPIDGVVTGTIFSYLPKNENNYSYILFLTTSNEFIEFTISFSKGTKMPIIGWDDFCSYKKALPKEEILNKFNQTMMHMLLKIQSNIKEIQSLSQTRDSLLPRLMSGKIRVKG